jgi:hypothetical protein
MVATVFARGVPNLKVSRTASQTNPYRSTRVINQIRRVSAEFGQEFGFRASSLRAPCLNGRDRV